MNKNLKIMLSLVLTFALLIGTAGCSSGSTNSGATATLTIGSTVQIDTLNPLTSNMQVAYEVFLLIYDPLVRADENLKPVPCLAKEWTLSADQLTWTFKLQQGVKWHDGEPFTSKDVKFTYDLMKKTNLGYQYNSFLTGISKIECPDDNTVVITTDKPKANMLMNTTPILPEHIFAKIPTTELETYANAAPVGTGPFKFDSTGEGFVKLVKNPDYFGGAAKLDEIILMSYSNSDVLAQALKLGEVDAATNLNATQKSQLKDDKNISIISGEVPGFMQIGLNCWADSKSAGNPLLRDKKIRQAIELATDKQQILDMAYGGEGKVGTTLINPGDFYHYEPTAAEKRDFNIDKANAMLDAAGYKDTNGDGVREDSKGKMLEFKLISIADKTEEVKAAQLIAASCAKAGIKIDTVTMDDGALSDKIYAGSYDMFIWGWGADIDPTTILGILTTEQIGGNNEPYFTNARYDELFKLQMSEMDVNKRQKLVFEMQQIAYENAPYIIMIYDNNLQAIRSDRWTGFKQIPEAGPYFFNFTYYNYMNMQHK
ncbi:MAG: ABC transporter substrate-binding protein [Eubacteriales bacterium]